MAEDAMVRIPCSRYKWGAYYASTGDVEAAVESASGNKNGFVTLV